MKRKSSDSGSQSEKKVKIERKPEDRKTEKKDVKLIKKTTSTKTSTKTDVKRPENKKTEKPKRMFMTFLYHFLCTKRYLFPIRKINGVFI